MHARRALRSRRTTRTCSRRSRRRSATCCWHTPTRPSGTLTVHARHTRRSERASPARADHLHLLNGTVPRALDEAVAIARLTASVLEGVELRPERFAQIARQSFVTAADVADVLALTGQIDYRSAHEVVGRAVRDLVESGEPPSELTPARLAAAAEATIGRPVELDEATLRDALDPAACAAARRQ